LQEATKNFPVVLFVSSCGDPCEQARTLLRKRGIPFSQKDAADPAVQAELGKLLGTSNLVVPVLTIGRALQRGFEEGAWNTALDSAGYPKTSVLPANFPNPPAPSATPSKADEEKAKAPKEAKDKELTSKKSAGQYPVPQ